MSSDPALSQSYVEYLEKESTLVGLLATFAIGAGALILQATLGAKDLTRAAKLWEVAGGYLSASSALCVTAAVAFFRQRSLLAYYVGQLALAQALGSAPTEWQSDKPLTTSELLLKANAWSTWFWYQTGWVFLTAAAAAFVSAVLTIPLPLFASPSWQFFVALTLALCATMIVMQRHRALAALDA